MVLGLVEDVESLAFEPVLVVAELDDGLDTELEADLGVELDAEFVVAGVFELVV